MGCPATQSTDSVKALSAALKSRLVAQGRWRRITLDEVAQHASKDSGWIVVDGKVYDISHHVQTHPGWTCGCAVSTLSAILRTLGTDCSEEVHQVHSKGALLKIQPYMIGELCKGASAAEHPSHLPLPASTEYTLERRRAEEKM